MEPVYQCCYTNATQQVGDRMNSGWQVCAASADIPGKAGSACARLQNANSSLCSGAVDEEGNVLTLREYVADGSYLYVIRSQFGLTDRLGRPNMFSHGIIFPLQNNKDLLWNPNYYLALKESSFIGEGEPFSWTDVPHYGRSISMQEAMDLAGIDREKLVTLVRCVCAQINDPKARKPLYIQYNGDPRQMQGLLYCICGGIPRGIFRQISIASCPTANDRDKHLVFSRSAQARGHYLVPQTGENTLLTQHMLRRISRSGYVDYAPRELPLEQFPAFFKQLDEVAAALGDASGADPLVLKLAFQFACRRAGDAAFTDSELESGLSDALRLQFANRWALDIVLTRILQEFSRRGLVLNGQLRSMLDAYLAGSDSAALKAAGRACRTQ